MHRSTPPSRRRVTAALCRALIGLLVALPATAAAQSADSARAEPLFTAGDALILGAFALGSFAVSTADERIVRELRDPCLQENGTLGSLARGAKVVNERSLFAASALGWGVARLAGADGAADVSLHVAEAVFVSSAMATVVRGVLGRSRPFITNGEDAYDFEPGKGFGDLAYRAYPSIHASATMGTAAVLVHELRRHNPKAARVAAPLLYTASVLPGAARMYSNKHWASDVVMGLGLGWWTGRKVVRYHHSRERTKSDRWLLGANGVDGVMVTFRF
jgi:membrane-associated phospholipid phosphatase